VPHIAEATFGARVRAAISALGPLCVGIDPSPALLECFDLPDDAEGVERFAARCIEELHGVVGVVKPQVAFFERHGSQGMAVFERTVVAARAAGMLVIADAKRGDIGSTAEAYADAWFRGPLAADALTAAPYVGLDALGPMARAARATGRGLIVVVTSSNPEGRAVQAAVGDDGLSVEEAMLQAIGRWNKDELASVDVVGPVDSRPVGVGPVGLGSVGSRPVDSRPVDSRPVDSRPVGLGSVGAVVGATGGAPPAGLGALGGVVLAPGLGAQGATVADVARRFCDCPPQSVLAAASRLVLRGGPGGLRAAAGRLRDELAGALG
jgi:orotidine-5'-phosphate decarboxylase